MKHRYNRVVALIVLAIAVYSAVGYRNAKNPESDAALLAGTLSATAAVSTSEPQTTIGYEVVDAVAYRAAAEVFPGNAELARIQLKSNGLFRKFVVFPDGARITVHMDLTWSETGVADLDDGKSPDFFAALQPGASVGDGPSAYRLYEALQSCLNAPNTDAALEAAIARARNSGTAPATSQPQEIGIELLERVRFRCGNTEPAMYAKALEYLKLAADRGHVRSALAYADHIEQTDPLAAIRYYTIAWDAGSLSGARGIGRVMNRQTEKSFDESVMAFAYSYAGAAVELAIYDGLHGEVTARARDELVSALRREERQASASALMPGYRMARRLIENNIACCRM